MKTLSQTSEKISLYRVELKENKCMCIKLYYLYLNQGPFNKSHLAFVVVLLFLLNMKCLIAMYISFMKIIINEPVHEISNNVVCATSKASDQPVHMRSLIRAFASRLSIL